MLFDLVVWLVLILVALAVGSGALAVLGADHVRAGDRFVLGAWLGIVSLALALLGASVFAPLTSGLTSTVGVVLTAVGWTLVHRLRGAPTARIAPPDVPVPFWAVVAGVTAIAVGAAALASDPVTLYDSLVYHVGIVRWLHEYGVVPGVALIHNRLGHLSAWFALGAAFDGGPVAGRAANVPLGLALVLVALQTAIGAARIASGRATGADWFLVLASSALIWAAVAYNAATPSPDVATNALIVVTTWAMLVVPRAAVSARAHGWRRWFGPRLIPLILAIGACGMKLFAIPAAVVAAVFYIFARADDRGARDAATRAVVSAVVASVMLAPVFAANLTASGCPLYPSPIACLTTPWSVGVASAGDYTEYIRDVARWESRRSMASASQLPWIGSWIVAHPLITTLAALAPLLASVLLLRGPRRDGVRSALLLAVCGIAFAAWQAPAPRFLYAFVIVVPALALAFPLASVNLGFLRAPTDGDAMRRAAAGFVAAAIAAGLGYAVASQKLNVRSALTSDAAFLPRAQADLLIPAAAQAPAHLYRWRVNDVDVLTPVPRPVADTLGYRSAIDGTVGFEKCSTAPLPCTPYLPSPDVRLRLPERGISGGFVRRSEGTELSRSAVRCVGELDDAAVPSLSLRSDDSRALAASRCGERDGR